MSIEWVGLVLALVAAAAGGVWAWRVLRYAIGRKVGVERATGNLPLRARMQRMAGHRHFAAVQETVTRAETMRGWVWIRATRRPRQSFREELGWAPFRWLARRALNAGKPPAAPGWRTTVGRLLRHR